MSKTTRRLGRGLDTLVGDLRTETLTKPAAGARAEPAPKAERAPAGQPMSVELDALAPNPFQPRGSMQEAPLRALAESLKTGGMIQPISARRVGDRLEIIAGERRWRAARIAGLNRVPVIVAQADDRQMLEMALVENIHREDLNPIDRARAYRRYCDEFALSAEELATRVGDDRSTVSNYLRLLDLPDAVQDLVRAGRLSMGHARCIVGVPDNEQRLRLAKVVMAQDLSVRALEGIVQRERKGQRRAGASGRPTADRTPHLRDLEERFSRATGTKVSIQEGRRKGSGRILIEYYSLDDFDRISGRLGLEPD